MAGAGEVKLLGNWRSPFVMRARVALNLKGVSYEFLSETRLSEQAVAEYIDEVWSSSCQAILPADPHDRAVARFWATYIEDKWNTREIILAPTEEAKAEAVERLSATLLILEVPIRYAAKTKTSSAETPLCTLTLFSAVVWAGYRLVGWAERFYLGEAVRELVSDTDDLLEYSKDAIAYYGPRLRA